VDELSIVSVPTGSLLSSQSDKAVGGLSHVAPLSTQLGRPSSSATVTTEGTGFLFSDYHGSQSTSGGTQEPVVLREFLLPVDQGMTEVHTTEDSDFSLPSPDRANASNLLTATPSIEGRETSQPAG
jgi:hypothetical protein